MINNSVQRHGLGSVFSCKGIEIAVDYFIKRGHTQIKALVPRFRRGTKDSNRPTTSPEILDKLQHQGYIIYTPSVFSRNRLKVAYDDNFILTAATHYNGIIVSNDNYRDLTWNNAEWKKQVETSRLGFSFIGDLFIVPPDPLGRGGPSLDQYLSVI